MNAYELSSQFLGGLVEEAKVVAKTRKTSTVKPVETQRSRKSVDLFLESIELVDEEVEVEITTTEDEEVEVEVKTEEETETEDEEEEVVEESITFVPGTKVVTLTRNGDDNYEGEVIRVQNDGNIVVGNFTGDYKPAQAEVVYYPSELRIVTIEEGEEYDFEDTMQQISYLISKGDKKGAKALLDELLEDNEIPTEEDFVPDDASLNPELDEEEVKIEITTTDDEEVEIELTEDEESEEEEEVIEEDFIEAKLAARRAKLREESKAKALAIRAARRQIVQESKAPISKREQLLARARKLVK